MKNLASIKELNEVNIKKPRKIRIELPLLQRVAKFFSRKRKRTFEGPPVKFRYLYGFLSLCIPLFIFWMLTNTSASNDQLVVPQDTIVPCIWQICSIDTMKASRDMARDNLYYPLFDTEIASEMQLIKDLGANFVAINTPYDEEFMPYLQRWIKIARSKGLNVYFRGNWSEWEGWFGYAKNMTPEQHLTKTAQFILTHPDIFEDGDLFDPCPECENAGFWPQNQKNQDYRAFIQTQQSQTEVAFQKINKQVVVFPSIIGGRAKDVLDQSTFDRLHNTISIDHYVNSAQSMSDFIAYFKKAKTKTFISEFGIPIPDLNGSMTEQQQADFLEKILDILYQKKDQVVGLNYWVLSVGTTSLINSDGSKRLAYYVLQKYFKPALITGKVINPLGEGISDLIVKTKDGKTQTKTDKNGNYRLIVPAENTTIQLNDPNYPPLETSLNLNNGQIRMYTFTVEPKNPSLLYTLKRLWKRNVLKS